MYRTALKPLVFCDKLNVSTEIGIWGRTIEENSIDIRRLASDDYVCLGRWDHSADQGTG